MKPADAASLADWRRQVAELYARWREDSAADPERATREFRAARDRLFREHPQSPLPPAARAGFHGLPYFDYDPGARLAVRLAPASEARWTFEAGGDGDMTLRRFARTEGLAARFGGELDVWWIEGYGGGRYLIDAIKGADLGGESDGRAILDFNFAYQPSCAYDPRWVCPLAPPSNRLIMEIRAGERL